MNDELQKLLSQHDPATGKSLTSFNRTRTLESARTPRLPGRVRRAWLVAAVTMLVVTMVTVTLRPRHEEPRQIQYATPGGTRIVWTLDPNFHM
jgi:hypothetical protein